MKQSQGSPIMADKRDYVALTDAIASLREQIREAAERARHLPEKERFRITEVELELTVAAEDSGKVGAGVGWFVFKASADISAKDTVTHKVKLKLDVGSIEVGSTIETK
jgi:hypothetical protein